MKFKTLTVAALTILSISQGVSAKEKIYIGDPTWTENKYVFSANNGVILSAELGFSVAGLKSIYFSRYSTKNENVCEKESDIPEKGLAKINGVNVKVNMYCQMDSGLKSLYQSITPTTYRGLNYVMGQFSKQVKPVEFYIYGDKFLLKTIGFNKTSKELGSNPI